MALVTNDASLFRGILPLLAPPMLIYKIIPESLWLDALERGVFAGAPVDLADGFIHFSTGAQVVETARRHFHGQSQLLLLTLDDQSFGDKLIYEPSRGGDFFPHLYDQLQVSTVKRIDPLPLKADGTHDFEGLLP